MDELAGEKDLLAIAQSQLGYQESTRNYEVAEDGETIRGYTRYGAWYGDPYGDWCAMFVSWCANAAGVDGSTILRHSYTENGLSQFKRQGRAYSRADVLAGKYTPQAGDIIYFLSSSFLWLLSTLTFMPRDLSTA